MHTSDWTYRGEPFEDAGDHVGFVYVITNLETNRRYVGKKKLQFNRTRQVKKRKKHYKIESDWKEYFGSNEELKTDVERLGKGAFSREILYLCSNLSQMSYYELKEQILRGVLESDDYYNTWIMVKVRKTRNLLLVDKPEEL